MITDFELGWLVGILEGEGHFRYSDRTQRVTVNMTDEDTIIKVAALFEEISGQKCTVRFTDRSLINSNHQLIYHAVIHGAKARAVMQMVVKHMGYRRRQKIWQCLNKFVPKQPKFDVSKIPKVCAEDNVLPLRRRV